MHKIPGDRREPVIIGLIGKRSSGKSTFAQHLQKKHGAEVFSFATPLRSMARDLYGFRPERMTGEIGTKEECRLGEPMSPRAAMIKLGNCLRLEFGNSVLVRRCLNLINDWDHNLYTTHEGPSPATGTIYVIDDVRLLHEAQAIQRALGFRSVLIKINRAVCIDDEHSNDYTEVGVDKISDSYCDLVLPNDHHDVRHATRKLDTLITKLQM